MANIRPADSTELSKLMTSLHVSNAGVARVRALVDQWREGRDTVNEIRRVLVDAATYAAGEPPECDRAAERWRRALDSRFNDIDRALTKMRRAEAA